MAITTTLRRDTAGPHAAADARNFGLDLARAAAIALVLVAHFAAILAVPSHAPLAIVALGLAGVELFFSLSGFLIGRILIALARDGMTAPGAARFLGRRWFRTLPAYYATWLVMSALFAVWNWRDLLFLQEFGAPESPVLVVAWSLVLEEWFYLLVPVLLLALAAATRRKRIGAQGVPGGVLAVALAVILLSNALRLAATLGAVPIPGPALDHNPIARLDCAAYGLLVAALNDIALRGRDAVRLNRLALVALLAAPPAALAWLALAVLAVDPLFQQATAMAAWGPYYETVKYPGFEIAFAALVFGLAYRLPRTELAARGAITGLSRISYSVYLVHVPVLTFCTAPAVVALGRAAAAAALLAATLIAAYAMNRVIEQPFLALRGRLLPHRRAGQSQVPPLAHASPP